MVLFALRKRLKKKKNLTGFKVKIKDRQCTKIFAFTLEKCNQDPNTFYLLIKKKKKSTRI